MTEVEQLDEYDARGLPFIVDYEDEWGINEEELPYRERGDTTGAVTAISLRYRGYFLNDKIRMLVQDIKESVEDGSGCINYNSVYSNNDTQ